MTDRYVAPAGSGGSDSNPGTFASPWLTLSKALTDASVGDTVYFRAGTYGHLFFNGRDTITITNYPGEAVIFERATSGNVLNFENCRNMTFRGNTTGSLTVKGTTAGNGSYAGVRMYYLSSASPNYYGMSGGHVLDNITIHQVNGFGVYADDLTTLTVQNCSITDTGTGIMLKRLDAGLMAHNDIYDNQRMIVSDATPNNDYGGMGIALDVNTDSVICEYNTIHGNHATSIDYGVDGSAFEIYSSTNCTIRYNTCWDNEVFIETGSDQSTHPAGNVVHHNLIYGRISFITPYPGLSCAILLRAARDMLIYNNTFDVDDGLDIFRIQEGTGGFYGPLDGLRVKNNIIRGNHATSNKAYVLNKAIFTETDIEIDYNLVYNPNGSATDVATRIGYAYDQTERAAWTTATGYSAHDVWGSDPLFTDRTGRDYTLAPGSPARNAGVVLSPYTDGYVGAAPDIGRYEDTAPPADAELLLTINGADFTADVWQWASVTYTDAWDQHPTLSFTLRQPYGSVNTFYAYHDVRLVNLLTGVTLFEGIVQPGELVHTERDPGWVETAVRCVGYQALFDTSRVGQDFSWTTPAGYGSLPNSIDWVRQIIAASFGDARVQAPVSMIPYSVSLTELFIANPGTTLTMDAITTSLSAALTWVLGESAVGDATQYPPDSTHPYIAKLLPDYGLLLTAPDVAVRGAAPVTLTAASFGAPSVLALARDESDVASQLYYDTGSSVYIIVTAPGTVPGNGYVVHGPDQSAGSTYGHFQTEYWRRGPGERSTQYRLVSPLMPHDVLVGHELTFGTPWTGTRSGVVQSVQTTWSDGVYEAAAAAWPWFLDGTRTLDGTWDLDDTTSRSIPRRMRRSTIIVGSGGSAPATPKRTVSKMRSRTF